MLLLLVVVGVFVMRRAESVTVESFASGLIKMYGLGDASPLMQQTAGEIRAEWSAVSESYSCVHLQCVHRDHVKKHRVIFKTQDHIKMALRVPPGSDTGAATNH